MLSDFTSAKRPSFHPTLSFRHLPVSLFCSPAKLLKRVELLSFPVSHPHSLPDLFPLYLLPDYITFQSQQLSTRPGCIWGHWNPSASWQHSSPLSECFTEFPPLFSSASFTARHFSLVLRIEANAFCPC